VEILSFILLGLLVVSWAGEANILEVMKNESPNPLRDFFREAFQGLRGGILVTAKCKRPTCVAEKI
jgi:hypothetical protein